MTKAFHTFLFIVLSMTSISFAGPLEMTPENSGDGDAFAFSGGPRYVTVLIEGEAARIIYDGLKVQIESKFGFLQTFTKKTKSVTCTKVFMGDTSDREAEPAYNCSMLIEKT